MADNVQVDLGYTIHPIQGTETKLQQQMRALEKNLKFNPQFGPSIRQIRDFASEMDRANQRVITLGASFAVLSGSIRTLKDIVRSTIEVEKAFTEINAVFGLGAKNLDQFSKQLFDTARDTAQSFEKAASAAKEFSRQGLTAEETIRRTRDALILTRLANLDVTQSVETLTASINGFQKSALNSTEIVNKLATVDARFAVSSKDLAEGLSRAGAAASDAGVSFDQLIGLITSAQQTTARGGTVIGNSLKTIFTRVERGTTIEAFEALGVQVRDTEGQVLKAIPLLQNFAKTYDGLSGSLKKNAAELVGGVFQINILKALLGDLARANGIAAQATNVSNEATDEAVKRNEALNKSLDSMLTKFGVTAKQIGANIGSLSFAGPAKSIIGLISGSQITRAFEDATGKAETSGGKLAEGLLKGLGGALVFGLGPLLVTALGKIVKGTVSNLFRDFGDITKLVGPMRQQEAIQQQVVSLYRAGGTALQQQLATMTSLNEQAALFQRLMNQAGSNNSAALAGLLFQRGVRPKGAPRAAEGYIPTAAVGMGGGFGASAKIPPTRSVPSAARGYIPHAASGMSRGVANIVQAYRASFDPSDPIRFAQAEAGHTYYPRVRAQLGELSLKTGHSLPKLAYGLAALSANAPDLSARAGIEQMAFGKRKIVAPGVYKANLRKARNILNSSGEIEELQMLLGHGAKTQNFAPSLLGQDVFEGFGERYKSLIGQPSVVDSWAMYVRNGGAALPQYKRSVVSDEHRKLVFNKTNEGYNFYNNVTSEYNDASQYLSEPISVVQGRTWGWARGQKGSNQRNKFAAGGFTPFAAAGVGLRRGSTVIGKGVYGTVEKASDTPIVFKAMNRFPDSVKAEFQPEQTIPHEYAISKLAEELGLPVAKVFGTSSRSLRRGGLYKEYVDGTLGFNLNRGYDERARLALSRKFRAAGIEPFDLHSNNYIVKREADLTDIDDVINNSVVVDPGMFRLSNRKLKRKFNRYKTSAEGYIPFGEEASAISSGIGGAPSSARPVFLPDFNRGGGERGIVANTSEYVVPNFAGGGSAIFNQDMVREYGLPPGARAIAAKGYIPNAALGSDINSPYGYPYGYPSGGAGGIGPGSYKGPFTPAGNPSQATGQSFGQYTLPFSSFRSPAYQAYLQGNVTQPPVVAQEVNQGFEERKAKVEALKRAEVERGFQLLEKEKTLLVQKKELGSEQSALTLEDTVQSYKATEAVQRIYRAARKRGGLLELTNIETNAANRAISGLGSALLNGPQTPSTFYANRALSGLGGAIPFGPSVPPTFYANRALSGLGGVIRHGPSVPTIEERNETALRYIKDRIVNDNTRRAGGPGSVIESAEWSGIPYVSNPSNPPTPPAPMRPYGPTIPMMVKTQRMAERQQTGAIMRQAALNSANSLIARGARLGQLTPTEQAAYINKLRREAADKLGYDQETAYFNPIAREQVLGEIGPRVAELRGRPELKMPKPRFGIRDELSLLGKTFTPTFARWASRFAPAATSQNGALAAGFILPAIGAMLPNKPGGTSGGIGYGAAGGALTGAGFGASAGLMIGGPTGALVGAGIGAVTGGAIGALGKMSQSFEELAESINEANSKIQRQVEYVQSAFRLQGDVISALQSGAPEKKVNELRRSRTQALLSISDKKIREQVVGLINDPNGLEKATALLTKDQENRQLSDSIRGATRRVLDTSSTRGAFNYGNDKIENPAGEIAAALLPALEKLPKDERDALAKLNATDPIKAFAKLASSAGVSQGQIDDLTSNANSRIPGARGHTLRLFQDSLSETFNLLNPGIAKLIENFTKLEKKTATFRESLRELGLQYEYQSRIIQMEAEGESQVARGAQESFLRTQNPTELERIRKAREFNNVNIDREFKSAQGSALASARAALINSIPKADAASVDSQKLRDKISGLRSEDALRGFRAEISTTEGKANISGVVYQDFIETLDRATQSLQFLRESTDRQWKTAKQLAQQQEEEYLFFGTRAGAIQQDRGSLRQAQIDVRRAAVRGDPAEIQEAAAERVRINELTLRLRNGKLTQPQFTANLFASSLGRDITKLRRENTGLAGIEETRVGQGIDLEQEQLKRRILDKQVDVRIARNQGDVQGERRLAVELNALILERKRRLNEISQSEEQIEGGIKAQNEALHQSIDSNWLLLRIAEKRGEEEETMVRLRQAVREDDFELQFRSGTLSEADLRRKRTQGRVTDGQNSQFISGTERAARIMADAKEAGLQGDTKGSFLGGFHSVIEGAKRDLMDFSDVGARVAENLHSSMTDAWTSWATGAKSGKEAFRDFATSVLSDASRMLASKSFTAALSAIPGFGIASGGPIGFAAGGSVPAMLTGGEYVFGPNAARAIGRDTLQRLNGYANGGVVKGGSGVRDDVPARLPQGSFVIKKSATQKLGADYLNALAEGKVEHRLIGGLLGSFWGGALTGGVIGGGLGYAVGGKKGALAGAALGAVGGGLYGASSAASAAQITTPSSGFQLTGASGTINFGTSGGLSPASGIGLTMGQKAFVGLAAAGGLGMLAGALNKQKKESSYISNAQVPAYRDQLEAEQNKELSGRGAGKQVFLQINPQGGYSLAGFDNQPATRRWGSGGPVPMSSYSPMEFNRGGSVSPAPIAPLRFSDGGGVNLAEIPFRGSERGGSSRSGDPQVFISIEVNNNGSTSSATQQNGKEPFGEGSSGRLEKVVKSWVKEEIVRQNQPDGFFAQRSRYVS